MKRLKLIKDVQALKFIVAEAVLPNAYTSLFKTFKRKLRVAEEIESREEQFFLTKACLLSSTSKTDAVLFGNKMKALLDIISLESRLKLIQHEWTIEINAKKELKRERVIFYEGVVNELQSEIRSNALSSNYLEYSLILLRIRLYDMKRDYHGVIECATQGLKIVEKVNLVDAKGGLFVYMAYANGSLGSSEKFKFWLSKGYSSIPKWTSMWFLLSEIECSFYLVNNQFKEANDILQSITLDARFKAFNEVRKESWLVKSEYLHFSVKSGIWVPEKPWVKSPASEIKLSSNGILADKMGINVSLVVLLFLSNLLKEEFEQIIDRQDSVHRYLNRHIKSHGADRPKIFLGMLLKVIQLDFNPFEIEKKTRKQLEKLKTMNPNLNMNMGGNEIIRYEVLWEWILKKLKESSLLPKPKA